MKEILIVGAGGLGRELLEWLKDCNEVKPRWRIKGFLDDEPGKLDGFDCDHKIVGTITEWTPSADEVFACAIADCQSKERVVSLLKSRGATFESIIHPRAVIGDLNRIGEGLIAFPNSVITVNAVVGDFVTLLNSQIGHDAVVGDYSTISSYCDITGCVTIGKHVFLGSHVTVAPGRSVGDGAFLGAGSVVLGDVQANTKVLGNPARRIPAIE